MLRAVCVASYPTMSRDREISLRLLNEYKKRPVLWRKDHIDYNDRLRKNDAWAELSDIFNENMDVLKLRVSQLRGAFRRERYRLRKKIQSGTAQTYHSTWFAWDTMLFLDTDQRNDIEPNRELDSPQEIQDDEDDIFIDNRNQNVEVATFDHSEFDNDTAELPETEMESERLSSAPGSEQYDEFALFSMYIAEKLRKMDQRTQITLQHKISGLIFDAEMQAVNNTIIQVKTEPQD
ncbi:uncharacterized protein LOC109534805 [Dendroctonus ponderosae]|uniref:MADF domain-containing protein n=1 Tax=Dendroctonus ponderosae TaxID=77166 RepID=U4U8C8_DENPD|nr:uncharacterized protein LOC109534805 [Dendroctonus ponderosae]ERL89307.1 hypothetical protein D910_06679 [Dendroctonus ponderosae]KAH1027109.1 hypothetical protein HUJ05_000677 [Dendroctonus ponderosae]